MEKIIQFNLPVVQVDDWTIKGKALVWYDGSEGTRTQFAEDQYAALKRNPTIDFHRDDVIASFNHDFGKILGRQSNNTLQLQQSNDGLSYSIQLNKEDPSHQSIRAKVLRRDVTGSSATFLVKQHEWQDNLVLFSEIELIEVGPVSQPAMTSSTAIAASTEIQNNDWLRRVYETHRRINATQN